MTASGLFLWADETCDRAEMARCAPEDGDRAIADGACGDAALPVGVLALQVQAFCAGTGRDDQGVGGLGLLVLLALAPVAEGPLAEIDLGDRLGDDFSAEAQRLLAELLHQL